MMLITLITFTTLPSPAPQWTNKLDWSPFSTDPLVLLVLLRWTGQRAPHPRLIPHCTACTAVVDRPVGALSSDTSGWSSDQMVTFLDKLAEYRCLTPLNKKVRVVLPPSGPP